MGKIASHGQRLMVLTAEIGYTLITLQVTLPLIVLYIGRVRPDQSKFSLLVVGLNIMSYFYNRKTMNI